MNVIGVKNPYGLIQKAGRKTISKMTTRKKNIKKNKSVKKIKMFRKINHIKY
jgi:hypothetical protein